MLSTVAPTVELASLARASHDPYAWARASLNPHRWRHRCTRYQFEDGPLITALASVLQPRRVLELGTLLGYTGCSWASGGAQVVMVEAGAQHVLLAHTTVQQASLGRRAEVVEAEPEDALTGLPGEFDVIFVHEDLDTPDLRARAVERLTSTGLIIASVQSCAGEMRLSMAGPGASGLRGVNAALGLGGDVLGDIDQRPGIDRVERGSLPRAVRTREPRPTARPPAAQVNGRGRAGAGHQPAPAASA